MTNTHDTRTISGLIKQLNEARSETARMEIAYKTLISEVMRNAPECWGDSHTEAVEFVESLTEGGVDMPGHKDGCDCFE